MDEYRNFKKTNLSFSISGNLQSNTTTENGNFPLKTNGLIKLDHPANLRNLQLHLTAHRDVSADSDALMMMIKRVHFVISKRCAISVKFDDNLALLEELNDKFPYEESLSASSKYALMKRTLRMTCSSLICMKDSETNHEQYL